MAEHHEILLKEIGVGDETGTVRQPEKHLLFWHKLKKF